MNLSAESGYSLDFAGRVDNQPDLSLHTGSAVPSFHGTFTGGVNEQYSVEYSGAGTIGVTPNLSATIRNQSGVVIATHQVGEGYQAGTALSLENGLSFQLSSGDVNATDQASVFAVTDSDSTGLLAATGLNSFFDGVDVAGFRVRTEVFENPGNIAGTKSGITGDASNFASLAGLRDRRFGGLQQRTFVEEMADITADAGLQVQTARVQSQQAESYQQRLEADRAAVSGVDVNEEMLKIMEVERAYQAAARFITSVNATLDELFRIV
ncbi:MAG: flagellar basal body rod C-terminal domain-containing protein [Planctomycetaceae bacterium]